ncbi:scavenger receptor cysteine-rich type 1 protein M130-like [Acridotheres tristis]
MPGVEGAVAGLSAQALQRAGGMPELLAELQDAVGCQLVVTQVQAGEMESLQQAAAAQRVLTRETGQEGFGLCSLGELLQGQLRDAARCRSAWQSCAMGQGSSSRRRTARERHVMAICGVKPVPIRVAFGRLQQQQGWWKRGYRKGPPKHRCRGGAASPQHILVAAHCEEVCDARSGAEAHIWARSRLLEAAAPEPADEAPDKGCPAAAAACIGSGAGETCPGCAGSASLAWGRWWRWGCWCACSCVRVSGGRWERGPRRCRARLSSLRAAGSGELRLVDGGDRCAGRVEVKHDGEWGSVCIFDFDWEALWATVVCRQLGCGRVARASPRIRFGQGTGRIWLQPFFCIGIENALQDCPHFGWGVHFCGHEWDVGVTCTDAVELRLAGSGNPCAGRVEVKLQGQWGSVVDDRWDMEDAEVVCQHLGCGSAAGAYSARERFGVGDGPVNVALVDCNGNETALWDCEIRGWGPYKLNIHDWDTSAVCQGFSRLVGGDGVCAGQLEVQDGRAWVGVCDDQVDMKVAQVVCTELGCGEVLAMGGSGRFGAASGSYWDGGFQCNGSEPLLSACARRPAQSQGCSGRASIICSPYTGFRLENSSSNCSGRVEVAVRGTWGSVCAAEWDLPDAHVLCRHLGCGRALAVLPGGSFGSGEGPLRPDTFGCTGSERHPGECPLAVLGKPPCAPGNAAAVNCSGLLESLRLVEGETRCEGWLELAISTGAWRRVPGELLLLRNFSKVCWELGCAGLDKSNSVSGTVTLWDINETERAIMESVIQTIQGMTTVLTKRPEGLSEFYFQDQVDVLYLWWMTTAPAGIPHGAAIVCSGSRRVRLVGSSGRCAGRVEVYSGGSWSSVCQEGWDLQDAAVVCRELGCGTALEAPSSALFGPGTGPLWPYMAECSGTEESLWECERSEGRECGLGLGAGAVCSEQISVRLAGGRGRCRGYLEVSYNGTWGRVCSNGTSTGTAAAVCRQLGCGERGWLSAVPAQQPSRAWLAWVGCEDGARSLSGCPSAPWHLQSCGNGEHAHVECEEDTAGTTETNTNLYLEGATSTGVPNRITPAVAVGQQGTVSVPTVLCVVLGTLLCLALGVLAVLLCRARVWCRGCGRAADTISNAVYEELDYRSRPEYQEVPGGPVAPGHELV